MQKYIKNIGHNLPLLISAAALAVLTVRNTEDVLKCGIFLTIVLFFSAVRPIRLTDIKKHGSAAVICLSLFAALCFSLLFYDFMQASSAVRAAASLIGIPGWLLLGVCTAAAGICSLYFLMLLLGYLCRNIRLPACAAQEYGKDTARLTILEVLVCLGTAFAVISVCSKSSPLYPFNDWVDSNCFFTIGKSMLKGLVPYRDLYDQKGPLLYMLHALAAWISFDTFFGVYLLEAAAAFAFLLICRRILTLYHPDSSLLWIPVIGALVYSCYAFLHGDSVEELSLPLFAYCLFCGLKALHTDKEISVREGFLIGVTSACVLWMKFSLLGIYIGWFGAWLFIKIREGRFPEVLRLVLSILAGIFALSVPVLGYFLWQGAVGDLFSVYFYDNLFLYSKFEEETRSSGLLVNLQRGYLNLFSNNFASLILLALGVLGGFVSGKKKEGWLTALSALGLFALLYFSGVIHEYYAFGFSVFAPVGIAAGHDLVMKWKKALPAWAGKRAVTAVVLLVCTGITWFSCSNTYLMGEKKENLPQFQFAQRMNQVENPTMLNYGFLDGGFYNAAGIVPNCKFLCKINIPLPEMMETQDRFLDEGLVEFVVTRAEKLDHANYDYVTEATYYFEEGDFTYYLYQRSSAGK